MYTFKRILVGLNLTDQDEGVLRYASLFVRLIDAEQITFLTVAGKIDLPEAIRKEYPELGIMGGLDKNALARDRAAIDKEVEKARWMVEHGRYIPGFDHLLPDNIPWENMAYATEKLRELCFR